MKSRSRSRWDSNYKKKVLDTLGVRLGIKNVEDWYHITFKQIVDNNGSELLLKYGNSRSKMVKSIYKDYPWQDSKFSQMSWDNKENQRDFMERLGKRLGFKEMSDWYKITKMDIKNNGGGTLVTYHYGSSPSKLVMTTFGEHFWQKSKFRGCLKVSEKHWENIENRTSLINHLTKELQILDLEDWYRVSVTEISKHSRHMKLFKKYPLEDLLVEAYPDYPWNITKLKFRVTRSSQRWLTAEIKKLFPASGKSILFELIR
jgi:hypothetical protein